MAAALVLGGLVGLMLRGEGTVEEEVAGQARRTFNRAQRYSYSGAHHYVHPDVKSTTTTGGGTTTTQTGFVPPPVGPIPPPPPPDPDLPLNTKPATGTTDDTTTVTVPDGKEQPGTSTTQTPGNHGASVDTETLVDAVKTTEEGGVPVGVDILLGVGTVGMGALLSEETLQKIRALQRGTQMGGSMSTGTDAESRARLRQLELANVTNDGIADMRAAREEVGKALEEAMVQKMKQVQYLRSMGEDPASVKAIMDANPVFDEKIAQLRQQYTQVNEVVTWAEGEGFYRSLDIVGVPESGIPFRQQVTPIGTRGAFTAQEEAGGSALDYIERLQSQARNFNQVDLVLQAIDEGQGYTEFMRSLQGDPALNIGDDSRFNRGSNMEYYWGEGWELAQRQGTVAADAGPFTENERLLLDATEARDFKLVDPVSQGIMDDYASLTATQRQEVYRGTYEFIRDEAVRLDDVLTLESEVIRDNARREARLKAEEASELKPAYEPPEGGTSGLPEEDGYVPWEFEGLYGDDGVALGGEGYEAFEPSNTDPLKLPLGTYDGEPYIPPEPGTGVGLPEWLPNPGSTVAAPDPTLTSGRLPKVGPAAEGPQPKGQFGGGEVGGRLAKGYESVKNTLVKGTGKVAVDQASGLAVITGANQVADFVCDGDGMFSKCTPTGKNAIAGATAVPFEMVAKQGLNYMGLAEAASLEAAAPMGLGLFASQESQRLLDNWLTGMGVDTGVSTILSHAGGGAMFTVGAVGGGEVLTAIGAGAEFGAELGPEGIVAGAAIGAGVGAVQVVSKNMKLRDRAINDQAPHGRTTFCQYNPFTSKVVCPPSAAGKEMETYLNSTDDPFGNMMNRQAWEAATFFGVSGAFGYGKEDAYSELFWMGADTNTSQERFDWFRGQILDTYGTHDGTNAELYDGEYVAEINRVQKLSNLDDGRHRMPQRHTATDPNEALLRKNYFQEFLKRDDSHYALQFSPNDWFGPSDPNTVTEIDLIEANTWIPEDRYVDPYTYVQSYVSEFGHVPDVADRTTMGMVRANNWLPPPRGFTENMAPPQTVAPTYDEDPGFYDDD